MRKRSIFGRTGSGNGKMLSLKQLSDVCLYNTDDSDRCRYLARDDTDTTKWYCVKKSSKKSTIDDEVADFLKNMEKKGLDPRKQGVPLGDNCDGYLILKHVSQGYDQ